MKTAIFALLACMCASAQRPYVAGGVALFPSGYQPAGWEVAGGVMGDRPHVVLDTFFGYDNGRKENDGGPVNPKGHDRMLRGFTAYKFVSSYIGGGVRWEELDTTNYTKTNWHPEIGVGHDFWPQDEYASNFMRAQIAYAFKAQHELVRYPDAPSCYTCGNESKGVDITLWFPSPMYTKHPHVFCRMNMFIFSFHDNPADRSTHFADSTEILVGYKF